MTAISATVPEAQPVKSIRDCHEGLAWPSILLAGGAVAAFAVGTTLAVMGILPLWLGLIVNTIALIYAFVPLHDSTHGTIAGRDKNLMWVNHLVGFVTGLLLLYEYRAYKHLHMMHHRYPNDPENDPDYGMKAHTRIGAIFRNLGIVSYFQLFFLKKVVLRPSEPGNLKLAAWTLGFFAVVLAFFYWCITHGYGWQLLFLWILPLHLAAAILGLGIGYLLHTDGTGRYDNTDVMVFSGRFKSWLNRLYGYQNYHLIHHLYPRIPYYRYEDAFELVEPELRRNGTRIYKVGPSAAKTAPA